MAVSANQIIKAMDPDGRISTPVNANKNIYQGTLTFIDAATGGATDVINAGANKLQGVAVAQADNTGGVLGDKRVECYTEGVFELQGTGFAATDVGKLCYAVDNFTVNLTATNQTLVGRVVEFISSTKIRVDIEQRVI